jgi:serine protease Do
MISRSIPSRFARRLAPLGITTAFLLGSGCSHSANAGGAPEAAPNAPAPFATPPTLSGAPDVATLVAKVRPAVVNITSTHEVQRPELGMGEDSPFGMDMFPFFQQRRRGRAPNEDVPRMKQTALGSGFLIDAQGHVVTNNHVIDGADEVKVKLADEREFDAKVVGRDERLDLAVLELKNASNLPVASLGSSEKLRVGEYVVAIGNPFGLGDTVTMGIVSAKGRAIGAGPYDDFIQTDASINPGNSGGPLFDLHGQVVGINTAINPAGKGIGFAIPVDAVKDVLPQLLATGHVSRGRLGVVVQPVDAPLAKALGLDRPKGALVGDVEQGEPAEKAGIHSGDVIVSVDGTEVAHSSELPRLVARHAPGSRVKVDVLRDGRSQSFDVVLDKLTDENAKGAPGEGDRAQPGAKGGKLGIAVDESAGGLEVRAVDPDGPAADVLQPGDVIVEVNHEKVTHTSELTQKLEATPAGKPVLLRIERNGSSRFVAIEPKR